MSSTRLKDTRFQVDEVTWFLCFSFSAWMLFSIFFLSHIIIDSMYQYTHGDSTPLLDKLSKEKEIKLFVENPKKEETIEKNYEKYMSEQNAEARGRLTKKKGFQNLSEVDQFNVKQLFQEYAEQLQKEKRKHDLEKELEITILDSIIKKKKHTSKKPPVAQKIISELTKIPSSYDFNYEQIFSWNQDGEPQIPTFMYKYSQYFRNMGNKIRDSWAPPGGTQTPVYDNNYHKGGYTPGYISIQKYPSQDIIITFMIDESGEVMDIQLVESNGFKSLNDSLIEAIQDAKNFGPPPNELLKNNRLILPWHFRIY